MQRLGGLTSLCATLASLAHSGCGRIGLDDLPIDASQDAEQPPIEIHVQRGYTSLGSGVLATTAPLTPVDPAHSLLMFSVAAATPDPSDGNVAGQLQAAQVQFSRQAGASIASISWQVIEMPSVLAVQRGAAIGQGMGITSMQIPIAPVDLASSLAIVSISGTGTNYDEDDYPGLRFIANDKLGVDVGVPVGGAALPGRMEWQVATLAQADVHSGERVLDASTTSANAPIASVDPASSVLLFTSMTVSDAGNVASNMLRGKLGADSITFDRGAAVDAVTARWFIVHDSRMRVQSGTTSFATGELTHDAMIDAVDLERSFVVIPAAQHRGFTTYPGIEPDDQVGVAWFTAELFASSLHLERKVSVGAAELTWSVVSY